jgi:hypothetical protein
VKGGKHAYNWSEVSITGKGAIPDEALKGYNLAATCKLFLLSGSKRSGGFTLITMSLLKKFSFVTSIRQKPQSARDKP